VKVLLRGRGLAGLVLVLGVVALGLLAPVIAQHSPTAQIPGANLLPASSRFPLGTDVVDRDILSRVLFGIRADLVIIFVAVPVGALIGTIVALVGTLNRYTDVVVARLFDLALAFPAVILAIALVAITGPGLTTVAIVVIAVEAPLFGRLLRSEILRIRALPFVEAAQLLGAGRWWVLRRHIVPNAAEPLIVQLALSASVAVFLETALSFLGIGVRPPDPSLGTILNDAIPNLSENPWFGIGPLVVITALVLGFQLMAQAIGKHRRV
jgi:peptide/nickel transport system permease protein